MEDYRCREGRKAKRMADTDGQQTYEKMLKVIREMQFKTTMRYHLTPVRMTIINKSINNTCRRGCGERETLLNCWWECRLVQPLWKAVWRYLKKLKMDLPFDPGILLLEIYPKEPKTLIQKNLCTPMFIAAQFTITNCWKQPKCPSVNEWFRKLWYIYTMEFYTQQREIRSSSAS